MRLLAVLIAANSLLAVVRGQQPQVSINLDLWPSTHINRQGESVFRWYDNQGHTSTVSVTLLTEIGFKAFIAEKVQRTAGDSDQELLNEYYLEDSGHWRVGKQLLPFGLAELEREYVRAARVDTVLALGGWPAYIAVCDAGNGRQKGFVARVGDSFGLSIASGEHFGMNGSAFNDVRQPEDGLPVGGGYEQMFGADLTQHVGRTLAQSEWVRVRKGHRPQDTDNDFVTVRWLYELGKERNASITWARDVARAVDSLRFRLEFRIAKSVQIIPQVRVRDGRLLDGFLGARVKF